MSVKRTITGYTDGSKWKTDKVGLRLQRYIYADDTDDYKTYTKPVALLIDCRIEIASLRQHLAVNRLRSLRAMGSTAIISDYT
jgi:hypothetical protein